MKALKQIGKGSFTTAYRLSNNKVLLKSVDYAKECMAHGWFPNSRLFPKVEFSDDFNYNNEYIMKYYEPVTAPKKQLNAKSYALYQELRSLNIFNANYYKLMEAFKQVSDKRASKALVYALEALANYGQDIGFEISPRNISATDSGDLVLRDCFFMKSQLQETRKKN